MKLGTTSQYFRGTARERLRLLIFLLNAVPSRKGPEGKRHCGFLGDHGYDNKITSMQVSSALEDRRSTRSSPRFQRPHHVSCPIGVRCEDLYSGSVLTHRLKQNREWRRVRLNASDTGRLTGFLLTTTRFLSYKCRWYLFFFPTDFFLWTKPLSFSTAVPSLVPEYYSILFCHFTLRFTMVSVLCAFNAFSPVFLPRPRF